MNDTLISIGEALIDFIPNKSGCDFGEVSGFYPMPGGAPANVCAAFARLGGKSRLITKLGRDPFGTKIVRELDACGVETCAVSFTDEANTALAFVSIGEDGERTFAFYRSPSADMLLSAQELREEYFTDAYALHFCSVSLGDFPMRGAHEHAINMAKERGALISFDPNLRFPLWRDKNALRQTVLEFCPRANVLKFSEDELAFVSEEKDVKSAAKYLLGGESKLLVCTCGERGAVAFTEKLTVESAGVKVTTRDTTGAGDGFIGAFLWKLKECGVCAENIEDIKESTLKVCLDFANRFGAVSVTGAGAINSYHAWEENEI